MNAKGGRILRFVPIGSTLYRTTACVSMVGVYWQIRWVARQASAQWTVDSGSAVADSESSGCQ